MNRPVQQAWNLQKSWSNAASTAHATIDGARRLNLTLLAAAAVTGAIGGLLHTHPRAVRVAGVSGAVLLGLTGLVQQRRLAASQVGGWAAMRLASERLKSAVWRELALVGDGGEGDGDDGGGGGAAADDGGDSADAAAAASAARLSTAIDAAQAAVRDHGAELLAAPPATFALPAVESFDDYVAQRADSQATWHRSKGSTLLARARRLRQAELAVTVLGVGASAAAGAYAGKVLTPLVSMLSTIAAALAAHLSAAKHERVAAGYAITAVDLERAIAGLPEAPSGDERAAFVDRVEAILDRQNATWVALLSDG